MTRYTYSSARELFEAAREASRDAERIRRQLDAMSERAASVGGAGFEGRVSSTPEPDRMASRVAALVDMESRLIQRQAEDYELMDYACAVLYGRDNRSGLWSLVGWRADAIWHHYLGGLTWAEVGEMLGYTEQHVWQQAQVALDTCDGWGVADVIAGRGGAQD